mgnify:CR=1 FL=1
MASQDWFDKDFYKILGVTKGVSEAELKKTYRKLSRQFHPDTNPGDAKAEARFKEISEAYSVLSDKQQRAEYDQMRAMGPGGFGGGRGGGFPGGGQGFPGGAAGFEDVFSNLFGGGGFGGFGVLVKRTWARPFLPQQASARGGALQPVNDGLGRLGRGQQADPGRQVHLGRARLGHGGGLRQRAGALRCHQAQGV